MAHSLLGQIPACRDAAGQAPQLHESLGQCLVERVACVVGGELEVVERACTAAPGRDGVDVSAMDVDMITEPVNITAQVTSPDGKTESKPLVVTLQRASAKKDGQATEGKWIPPPTVSPAGSTENLGL